MSTPTSADYANLAAEMQRELAAGNFPRVKALATILPNEVMPPKPEPELDAPAPNGGAR